MNRPRNLARMSDGAQLGWAVLEALQAAHASQERGDGAGVLHLSQYAHFMALDWPAYADNLVTCPERHNRKSWRGIQLIIDPAFAEDQFEFRRDQEAL